MEVWPVQLTTNLQSIEIERLVNARKEQHLAVLSMLASELQRTATAAHLSGFLQHVQAMDAKDGVWYNEDRHFSDALIQAIEEKQAVGTVALQRSLNPEREIPNFFSGNEPLLSSAEIEDGLQRLLLSIVEHSPPKRGFKAKASVSARDTTDFSVYVGNRSLLFQFAPHGLTIRSRALRQTSTHG
jgi:hypothetical protein